MNAKRIKNLLTVVLTTSMVVGSTVTAFADAGVGEGSGTYEGGEMKYPTLSVTLPTIPEGTYDYIADPNGLIAATDAARYNADFEGTAGIFFLTADADAEADTNAKYTNKSKAQTVTNENAQDIDVTVKLEQKTAGSDIIKYADSATFEEADKENKLYLAVTDDAASDAKVAALSSTGAATLTTTVAGIPGNYKPAYDTDDGYGYVLIDSEDDDFTAWNECSYILTGALNTGAEWGDDVTFPAIKVTWSYAEHQDGPTVTPASMSTSVKSATINGVDSEATLKSVKVVKADNSETALTVTTQYTYKNNVFAIVSGKEVLLDATKYKKFILTYSDNTVVNIPIVAAD
jgi:hypothetical protein